MFVTGMRCRHDSVPLVVNCNAASASKCPTALYPLPALGNLWQFCTVMLISSVAQSCLTVFDPMNCSTPGFPVLHHLPECTQTHVHRVSDAIQPSHPLSSPSPPAFNLSQHQSLFQWVDSSHQVARVLDLPMNIQDRFPFRIDWFDLLAVHRTLKSLPPTPQFCITV